MEINERLAIVETKLETMSEDLAEIKVDLKTLINERHEGIGKKTMLLTIAGFFGAILSHLISFFRQ